MVTLSPLVCLINNICSLQLCSITFVNLPNHALGDYFNRYSAFSSQHTLPGLIFPSKLSGISITLLPNCHEEKHSSEKIAINSNQMVLLKIRRPLWCSSWPPVTTIKLTFSGGQNRRDTKSHRENLYKQLDNENPYAHNRYILLINFINQGINDITLDLVSNKNTKLQKFVSC